MPSKQITELPVAASAADADLLLLRQGASDHQCAVSNVRAGLLAAADNLSDVASPATARTNLDVPQTGDTLLKAGNLSGLASASTARTNLGLGTAAVATLGTSTGQVPTADQIPGLAVHGSEGFETTDTFVVPAGVQRIHYVVSFGGGGGGGGGGTGGGNNGGDGGAGGRSYIQDDDTSALLAGDDDDINIASGGGSGGLDDGRGGQGGLATAGGFGQNGFDGRTSVSGAPGGLGGRSALYFAGVSADPFGDAFFSRGGGGGAGASGAGGGGGGAPGVLFVGSIDTSARQGDTWNIVIGSGGSGGAGGTGGGSNGSAGTAGFVLLWW